MNNGFSQRMRERIAAAPDGSVFTASDFADIADTATIRQCLNRMVTEDVLRRVIRGVFEKPQYSTLLNEYVAVDPDKVAQALARSYHSVMVHTKPMNGETQSWSSNTVPTKRSPVFPMSPVW